MSFCIFFDFVLSFCIAVYARLGLKPSSEPKQPNAQHHSSTTASNTAHAASSVSSSTASSKGNQLTVRDLQGVFASSLVSAASLDFLSLRGVADEAYADAK